MNKPKPSNKLSEVKSLIDNALININAQEDARNDFNWGTQDIRKCLKKLNHKYYSDDPEKNHFYKTEDHNFKPDIKVDIYKAKRIMEGFSIYTHFYIENGSLIISSFKEF